MLIDNDEVTLELAARFLENAGFVVRKTTSSQSALEMLSHPGLQLVISEVNLRHLNGFDLASIMQKCQIDVPLIFMTSSADEGTRLEAELLGAARFLSKKQDFESLPNIACQVLGLPDAASTVSSLRIH